jgi:hypothetical protein
MSDCGHKWEPCPGWNGRYRCEQCRCLAYKNLVNGGAKGVQHEMTVYICTRKDCQEPAVTHRKSQLCRHHAEKAGTIY